MAMVNGVLGQGAQASAVQVVEQRLDELEDATLQSQ